MRKLRFIAYDAILFLTLAVHPLLAQEMAEKEAPQDPMAIEGGSMDTIAGTLPTEEGNEDGEMSDSPPQERVAEAPSTDAADSMPTTDPMMQPAEETGDGTESTEEPPEEMDSPEEAPTNTLPNLSASATATDEVAVDAPAQIPPSTEPTPSDVGTLNDVSAGALPKEPPLITAKTSKENETENASSPQAPERASTPPPASIAQFDEKTPVSIDGVGKKNPSDMDLLNLDADEIAALEQLAITAPMTVQAIQELLKAMQRQINDKLQDYSGNNRAKLRTAILKMNESFAQLKHNLTILEEAYQEIFDKRLLSDEVTRQLREKTTTLSIWDKIMRIIKRKRDEVIAKRIGAPLEGGTETLEDIAAPNTTSPTEMSEIPPHASTEQEGVTEFSQQHQDRAAQEQPEGMSEAEMPGADMTTEIPTDQLPPGAGQEEPFQGDLPPA
ncbi:hypothetical protein OAN22_02735, partial [Alphaproteobacteria bacterium]|nr:hypothetical protein [Alphaproteobacteria bacterium]